MIECTECGFRNEEDDHFCGGCREPLEWTGRRIEELEEDVAEEDSEATDERGGLVERVLERLDSKRSVEDPGPAETQVEAESQRAEQDVASTVTAEAVARAEREVEEAVRAQSEAEQRAQEQAGAAELARVRAEEARATRERAEQSVQEETEEAARVREELDAAKAARQVAEEELERESEAAADARRLADEFGDEQRRHEAVEAELQQEREAVERAQAELEQAEVARRQAEERAQAEVEAAKQAARDAAAAEEARVAAEAKAREEADAAEQARRAAALVARPKSDPPDEQSGTDTRSSKTRGSRHREKRGRRGEGQKSGSSGPGPRPPDRPKIRKSAPQEKQKPSRRLRPGDLICGQCGEGNTPTRNYCRRCGHELQEAEVVRRPWWKRWIPRRKPRVYEVDERPGRAGRSGGGGTGGVKGAVRGAQGLRRRIMGPIGKVARVLAIVAFAAGAAGLAFNPDLRSRATDTATDAYEWVRQRIAPQPARVIPVAVEASSARADTADGFCCAAENVENFGNTWWHASEGGVGQFLVLILDTPTTITDFGIIPGAGDDTIWSDHPRPRDLEVDFVNDEGRTVATVDITDVKDEHGDEAQVFDIDGAEDVTSVRVTVTRVYGENLESDDVAISEIRLWTRR